MTLEQGHLPVVTLLWHKVKVAVNRAFAHARLEGKLVDSLLAVVSHVATHSVRSHPGWTDYMVARELLPDTFGNVEPEGVCHPLQVVIRKVVDCQGIPEAHSVSQI